MEQIVKGYGVLARNKVLHRNIKPENILMMNENELEIKLTDLGLVAKKDYTNEYYVAPEIYNKSGSFHIVNDVWSIGAVMYFMLNGRPPVMTEEERSFAKFPMKVKVKPDCSKLVARCLQNDYTKRIAFDDILIHPFFEEEIKIVAKHSQDHEDTMKQYHSMIKEEIVNKKLLRVVDYKMYSCCCKRKKPIILYCKHSFCPACIGQILEKSYLKSGHVNYLDERLHVDATDFAYIEIKCPKCLAYFKISNCLYHYRTIHI